MDNENKTIENAAAGTTENKSAAKMKKVRIKVPIDPLNKGDSRVQCGINGKFYDIQRGKEVTVPENVYTLLEEGGYSPSLLGEV